MVTVLGEEGARPEGFEPPPPGLGIRFKGILQLTVILKNITTSL